MSLDGAHHANEPTVYDESAFTDFVGTPWLSGIIMFASVVGTFVGSWTLILLFGQRHRGVSAWVPLILILLLDVGVNVGLRLWRRRRRRALGLSDS
ncbi:MAG TPA: hypothetical protein VG365_09420 [Solirubrobacteraceae bacterium]|jgi:hypothetical protein|nr:hypothetical protein [Solirubrobacteraceae bacterium]